MAELILIVDDEIDLAESCARVLKGASFNCLIAHNVATAIALSGSYHLELVLSDIDLVIGNGFEIARHVRAASPSTPVILMSAYGGTDGAKEAAAAGVAGYLRKPFSNAQLIAMVRSVLGH